MNDARVQRTHSVSPPSPWNVSLTLPAPEHLAFYAGIGAMAVLGMMEWPSSQRWWWVTRSSMRSTAKFFNHLARHWKKPSGNVLRTGTVLATTPVAELAVIGCSLVPA